MPKASIQFAPSALEDLQTIATYYNDQGASEIGRQMIISLIEAVKELARYPEMGRIVPEFNETSLRELIRPPFRVVYRLEQGQKISVIRIWRSERILELPQ